MSVLTFGGYICTADHAVQESYLLSLASTAVRQDRFETGHILTEYADGSLSVEEAAESLLDLCLSGEKA